MARQQAFLQLAVLVLLAAFPSSLGQTNTPPFFSASLYVFQINEEVPGGTIVGTLEGDDLDGDTLVFSVPNNSINSGRFDISNFGGNMAEIFVLNDTILDRELLTPDNEPLSLFVRLSDGNEHGVIVETEVNIYLLDINDEAPQFTNLPNTIEWPESTPVGTELFVVAATDEDLGVNAQILYSFSNPTDMFSIGVSTGVLKLAEPLDFESERSHRIPILAMDRGDPIRSTVRDLVITVIDVNDEPPMFEQPLYFVEIHENLTRGENVTEVRARDGDGGINDDIVYSILAGNQEINGIESFVIDPDTGVISVNVESLDRDEAHEEYTLTVMATEANDSNSSATVDVEIVVFDINDNSPFFQQSNYTANISESDGIGDLVVIVTAEDIDLGTNAEFTFRLENLLISSVPLPFAIEHNVTSGDGRIIVNDTRLDFETTEIYLFRVIATEVIDEEPKNGSTIVFVYVDNVNDNDPVFSSDNYTAMVAEEGGPEFVIMVNATDADAGTLGDVQYRLVSGDVGRFNITADSGEISTTERLNFEDVQEYVIVVEAFDLAEEPTEIRRTRVNLHVEVINLNDNQPSFVSPEVSVTVEEGRPASEAVYTVEASDEDGDLTELTFEIVNGSRGRFQLNTDNVIETTEVLDYDGDPLLRTYQLEIIVNDTEQINTLLVNISVMDINDNNPEFENNSYTFEVQENMNIGTFVGAVFAADSDSELFGEVEYQLDGPGSESFFINETTGEIFTMVGLDREDVQQYELNATATDLDPVNPRSAEASVIVIVLDENDNVPVFDQNVYLFEVVENAAVFSEQVVATDMDAGNNSVITYNIVSGNTNETFEIDASTGMLRRNPQRQIDREFQEDYHINVSATDGGVLALTSYALAVITVLDQNDNIPHFNETSYVSTIQEDVAEGSTVLQLIAEDDDVGSNGRLQYSITITADAPPNSGITGTFVINETTGTVTTEGNFDREGFAGPYSIQVRVEDGGFPIANNSTTNLTVFIQDINDNSPRYLNVPYNQTVSEGLPSGYSLLQVDATDDDEPNTVNSEVHYTITNVIPTNEVDPLEDGIPPIYHFSVNETSGELYTNVTLDYEAIRSYSVEVTASDSGDPQRSSAVFVTVSVEDINDQPPVFSESEYEFNITEDTPTSTRFEGIQAEDSDSADIMYSASISENFTIDSETGELVLVASLDFEEIEEYAFTVNATDGVFTDMANVVVHITDVNDHTPIFNMTSFTVLVDEGNYTSNPVEITTLTATDEDSGPRGTVTYSITAGNNEDIFYINNTSGAVLVRGNVDRETGDRFLLTIVARDGGMHQLVSSTELLVELVDVNDETPMFEMPSYEATVEENLPVNETVVRVLATDRDEGDNGVVLYSIDDNVNFRIDSGLILTNTSFDFEFQSTYTIVVTARDNSSSPLEANATVTVRILDTNDNEPFFTSLPSLPINISEGIPVGAFVAMVTATDRDATSNGEVRYRIANGDGKFAIDVNGTITVAASLDREIVPEYNLTIIAMDRGSPSRNTSIDLVVTLSDINDQIPTFTQTSYSFLVPEGVPLGNTVATLQVLDGDSAENGRLDFEVDDSDFGIRATQVNGTLWDVEVLNLEEFNYEDVMSYNLTVTAHDNGVPRQEGSTTVFLMILDTNDNSPSFSQDNYTVNINEIVPTGASAFQIIADDPDIGLNGEVVYSLTTIDGPFFINSSTGLITTTSSLDHESNDSHTIIVQACDRGIPQLCSNATVIFSVLDTNDEMPMFDLPIYQVDIFEDIAEVDIIVQPVAIDRDSGTNGEITYSIEDEPTGLFAINKTNGRIYLTIRRQQTMPLTFDTTYSFTVVATDGGTPSLNGSATITINAKNETVHPFRFNTSYFYFDVVENTAGFFELLELHPFVTFDVQFEPDVAGNPFRLFANRILLPVGNTLDREERELYTYIVRAVDDNNFSPPQTAYASVTVCVTDVNDEPPEFLSNFHQFNLQENQTAPVYVGSVPAIDKDKDATLTFTITAGDPDNEFDIDSQGNITTQVELDREDTAEYTLAVLVNDSMFTDTTTVCVVLVDINDNPPVFVNLPYTVQVLESSVTAMTIIYTVEATDADVGNNSFITYSIIGGNASTFAINESTGTLIVLPDLTFVQEEYILLIKARDHGIPYLSTVGTLTVDFIDDIPPVFTNTTYEFAVEENSPVFSGQVMVTDADAGQVTFNIIGNSTVFELDATTGLLFHIPIHHFDYESTFQYQFQVQANESFVLVSTATVSITIEDLNDNAPFFTSNFYFAEIQENTPENTAVVTVDASDDDSNIVFQFSLQVLTEVSAVTGTFVIEPSSGIVTTQGSFDRELFAGPYIIELTVQDGGSSSSFGTAMLFVDITDVNDNSPQFLGTVTYSQIVPENLPVNSFILQVQATDHDEAGSRNSDIQYNISNVIPTDPNVEDIAPLYHFWVNETTGKIFTNVSLDYEIIQLYCIEVTATDRGIPKQSTTISVWIDVQNENDVPPLFTETAYSFSIPEDTSVNSRFSGILAVDRDNNEITYISTITSPFSIDAMTGELVLLSSLDFEVTPNYTFTIFAIDGVFSDSADVIVNVLDVYDNHAPVFDVSSCNVTIAEDVPLGYSLSRVQAQDYDFGAQGMLTYAIISGDDGLFTIDQSGVVTVQGNLNRETNPNFTLVIQAEDGGNPSLTATAEVLVLVTDVINNVPTFENTSYSAFIEENTPPGQSIIRVTATDNDQGLNGSVSYSISDDIFFFINPSSGVIISAVAFDFELGSLYTFFVIAADAGPFPLSSIAIVMIHVVDQNDHPPVFSLPPSTVTVPENSTLGTVVASVIATDADSGDNAMVMYHLLNTGGKFEIDDNGIVYVLRALDYELTSMYDLTIVATDRGSPPLSSAINLIVTVTDVNDQQPTFSKVSYQVVIPESFSPGRTIAELQVVDGDESNAGEISFEIVTTGDGTEHFTLQRRLVDAISWKAEILIAMELDYEQQSLYSFQVHAYDGGLPVQESFANVTIFLLDVNDNAPQFLTDEYEFTVPEGAPIGSAVGVIAAEDVDTSSYGMVYYDFATGTDAIITAKFAIDHETGTITLLQLLDYEERDLYQFTVEASDISDMPLNNSTDVVIMVLQANDAAPVFDQQVYSVTVDESIPPNSILQVQATAGEAGVNVLYTIVGGGRNNFVIDEETGFIQTSTILDREVIARYILTVEARDEEGQTAFAQVDITVADTNDNCPQFSHTFYSYTVEENSPPGTLVNGEPMILSTDRDEGSNGEFRYSLSGGPFEIDINTGSITVAAGAALNRESTPLYRLSLLVYDLGLPSCSSTAEFSVTVTNANDNTPLFALDEYIVIISENSPPGTPVVMVNALDADSDHVAYSVLSGDDSQPKFSIDAETGFVQTTDNHLDREQRDSYILTVAATDDGNPIRSSLTEVMVIVEDVNDNPPVFSQSSYSVTVLEGNDLALLVLQVQATDMDLGTATYSISEGNEEGVFTISSETGELYALPGMLDYERQAVHTLRIAAVDHPTFPAIQFSSTATVTVTVEDVNEKPVFTSDVYSASVLEGAIEGTTVLAVAAEDRDLGGEGRVTYSFRALMSCFEIGKATGVITVRTIPDYETLNRYELVVEATDEGVPPLTSSVTVIVNVVNINEAPYFQRSFYAVEVSEDALIDTTVIILNAIDADSLQLTYNISVDQGRYFKINSTTGVIQVARSLDWESDPEIYLQVGVSDDGAPPRTSATTVQITILDVNDEAPVFLQSVYYANISETSPPGTVVTYVEARDMDAPGTQNSRVEYELEGSEVHKFNIECDSGIITLAEGLDREQKSMLTLTVRALDSGVFPRSSLVQLHIGVTDANDEPPLFSHPLGYAVVISETTTVGTIITTNIHATDPDTGRGGMVLYSLTSADPPETASSFNINGETGAITLVGPLDREASSVIKLVVTAEDQALPVHTTMVTVQIALMDVSDAVPVFSEDVYFVTLSEDLAVGSPVLQVTAEDADVGLSGNVRYSIPGYSNELDDSAIFMVWQAGNFSKPVTVNPVTGLLTTTVALDYESQDIHSITVQACDHDHPQICTNATVLLTVTDVNDNSPTFDITSYEVDIFDDQEQNATILQPIAVDVDSGSNGVVTYSLEDEAWDLFAINASTGQIFLTRILYSSDLERSYNFMVVAKDAGSLSLTGTTEVIVNVRNLSLHPQRFNTSYFYFEVPENAVIFEEPLLPFPALDIAFNPNTTNNPFELLENLIFKAPGVILDREEREVYTVTVQANFLNSSSSNTSVTVRVLDENDNPPQFLYENYHFTVTENQTPPVIVGTTVATDRDEGSSLVYSIDPQTDAFAIDSRGIITTTQQLDAESIPSYMFTIIANDSVFATATTVLVTVLDINDVTPTFTANEYSSSILEISPPGTSVAAVLTTDGDAGSNGLVIYSIVGGDNNIFTIDSISGVVSTVATLDFEVDDFHQLTVRATDQGSPALWSETTVNVQVLDFNDCPPMLVNVPSSLVVSEHVAVGSVVAQFELQDCDTQTNTGTTLEIVAGDGISNFAINSIGTLTVLAGLDRETQPTYSLYIETRDNCSLSSIAHITIEVEDVNDNAPVFSPSSYTASVLENATVGTTVLVVRAEDSDSGAAGIVSYRLLVLNTVFTIEESTGALILTGNLDSASVNQYELVVEGRDGGIPFFTSTTTVSIHVIGVNRSAACLDDIPETIPQVNPLNGTVAVAINGSTVTLVFVVEEAYPEVNTEDIGWIYINSSTGTSETDITRLGPRFTLSQDRLSLTITDVNFFDSGAYVFTARNPVGLGGASTDLSVYVPPTVRPSAGVAVAGVAGSDVTLSFVIEGAFPEVQPGNVEWTYVNNSTMESLPVLQERQFTFTQDRRSLMISNASFLNRGLYILTAENPAGSGSASISLTIYVLPIVRPIAGEENVAIVGNDITLSFDVVGAFPEVLTENLLWSVINGTTGVIETDVVGIGPRFSFSDDRLSLGITNVHLLDSGIYILTAINQAGSANASINLTIYAPPTAVSPSDGAIVFGIVGDTITLSFVIEGAIPEVQPEDIEWAFLNGTSGVLQANFATLGPQFTFSQQRLSLTINSISLSDSGVYFFTATNPAGSANSSVELIIYVEPRVCITDVIRLASDCDKQSNSTLYTCEEGQSITLECVSDGIPTPDITWLFNRRALETELSERHELEAVVIENICNHTQISYAQRSRLIIHNLTELDDGSYLCRADAETNQPFFLQPDIVDEPFVLDVTGEPTNFCESNPCQNGGTCTSQEFSYLCDCTEQWTGTNCATMVVIPIPAAIVLQPMSTVQPLYSAVNLTCIATGTPKPSVQWYMDDVAITGARLPYNYIPQLQLEHRALYHCEVQNNVITEDNPAGVVRSDNVVVNIEGIVQYRAILFTEVEGSDRKRRQTQQDRIPSLITEIDEHIAGTELTPADASILSLEAHNSTFEDESFIYIPVLITVLSEDGGSSELLRLLKNRLILFFTTTLEHLNTSLLDGSLQRFDGCSADVTIVSGESVLHWPESNIGENITLVCPCANFNLSNIDETRYAYRYCGGSFIMGAMWEEPIQVDCSFSETTRNLCRIIDIEDTEVAVQQLEEITADEENIEALDVIIITILLEDLIEEVTEAQNITLSTNFLAVIDNILDVESAELEESHRRSNTSARILETVEVVAEQLPIEENDTMTVVPLTSLIVSVQEVHLEEVQNQTLSALFGREFNFSMEEQIDPNSLVFRMHPNATASITIPSTVFTNQQNSAGDTVRVANAIFLTDRLFIRRESGSQVVGSIIISASIAGNATVDNLSTPIELTFIKTPEAIKNGTNTACNFWDPAADNGFGNWSQQGCSLIRETDDEAECRCNHLTNFAILLDVAPKEQTEPPGEIEKTLETITFIGVTVSICSLILTLLTYLSSRKLRTSEAGQMLINLCTGLLGIYVMYIAAYFATSYPPLCAVSAALVHYFFLATFILMAAEAVNLYIKLVIIMPGSRMNIERYPLKAAIIAWFVPVFIVGFSIAPDYHFYVGTNFCRPYDIPFYVGMLAPIVVIYVLNWFIFIRIMASFICKQESSEVKSTSGHKKSTRKKHFVIAVVLSLLFGLGWGFGLPATQGIDNVAVRTTFQTLFIILTGFHGLFIFIAHGIRNEQARREWKRWFTCQCTASDKPKLRRSHHQPSKGLSLQVHSETGPPINSFNKPQLPPLKESSFQDHTSDTEPTLVPPRAVQKQKLPPIERSTDVKDFSITDTALLIPQQD